VGKLLTIKANAGGPVQKISFSGKDYLSVPVIPIFEGVWNSEFVPGFEIEKSIPGWNGRPIILDHPIINGDFVSANIPETLPTTFGIVENTRWESGKLKFDAWLDLEKVNQLGGNYSTLVEKFLANQLVEGSTGYFRDLEEASGVWNGREYRGIAHNLLPDHYAFLLDNVGACSISDGCGAPRVNKLIVNGVDVSDSAIIGFYLNPEVAQKLMIPPDKLPKGSIPTEARDMHMTLAHMGKIADMPYGEDVCMMELSSLTDHLPIVRAKINGVGMFNRGGKETEDGKKLRACYASVDGTYLQNWQRQVANWMGDMFPVNAGYGFMPHITLAYIPEGEEFSLPVPEEIELVFDSVALSWGDRTTMFKLVGEAREENEMTGNKRTFKDKVLSWANKLGLNFSKNETGESEMTKCELIAKLRANGCTLADEALRAMDDKVLESLEADFAKAKMPTTNEETPVTPPPAETPVVAPEFATKAEIAEIKGMIEKLGAGIQANQNREHDELVNSLAERQTVYTKDELGKMAVNELKKLDSLVTPANYGGRRLPVSNAADPDWEEYKTPEVTVNGK